MTGWFCMTADVNYQLLTWTVMLYCFNPSIFEGLLILTLSSNFFNPRVMLTTPKLSIPQVRVLQECGGCYFIMGAVQISE